MHLKLLNPNQFVVSLFLELTCLELTHSAKHFYCSICAAVCALAWRILKDLGILPWLMCVMLPGTLQPSALTTHGCVIPSRGLP